MQLTGERVMIRSTSRANLEELLQLWNDDRVMRWVGFPDGLGYDLKTVRDWYARLVSDPDRHHFVVHTRDNVFCGEVYYALDRKHGRASLDIKLLPEAQGQGLASEALKMLIDHIFNVGKGINVVWTQPSKINIAAHRLYARCGLQPGERPDDIQSGESFWVLSRQEWQLAKTNVDS